MSKLYTAGMSIETNHNEGTGALGCFALDNANKPVLLSCSHVLFPGFKVIPNLGVYEPDYSSCCSGGDKIAAPVFDPKQIENGKFFGGFNEIPAKIQGGPMGATVSGHASETDCAIARLIPGIMFRNVWRYQVGNVTKEIPITGAVTDGLGVVKGPPLGTAPTPAQYVRVYTPRTGKVIYGTILSTPPADIEHVDDPDHLVFRWGISDDSDEKGGSKTNVNQFLILPRPAPVAGDYKAAYDQREPLSFDGGDSGSVVINSVGLVVGLICRMLPSDTLPITLDRSKIEFRDVGNFGVANLIKNVLDRMQITIPANPSGFSGTAPSAGTLERVFASGFAESPEIAAQRRGAERLRAGLRTSLRGRLLLGKIAQHRNEVSRLLASVRAINSAWNTLGGPAFYHHCVQSVRDPQHRIPTSINGVTRERLIEVVLPLFARHASPALRRDIERYGPWAASALLPINTLNDVPEAITRRRSLP